MPNKLPRPEAKPLIPASRVLVAVTNDIARELRYAREYGLGAEIQIFGLPKTFASDHTALLERVSREVEQLKGVIGCHGPFIDTIHYSTDPEIREVCRVRYLQAFDVAEALGANYVLFHSQYNPIIKVPIYPKIYHEESLKFWPEIIEEAEHRKISIYIENMFDSSPDPMRKLADSLDSPRFQLCLDVAHATIHSNLSIAQWIEAYGPHLSHVHVNDCNGELDDHLGLGQGKLDLQSAFAALKKTKLPLTYALETGKHTPASLKYLGISRTGR
ncbi:MAG: sugar phosphate isomerase/epimerase [Candidatus Hydrogenedentes bacterium]|nr:sugar phosphate isomerase/epimerase [Candidatus Hydrogenedentota bacterium]